MIAYIRGILTHILDDSIIVDVHGVGYQIICANPFVFQSSINDEVFVYTYHHVREDAQTLYGFKNEDEKYLFTKLISVSGIGPKSGLAIQGSVDVNDFVSAVEREDEKYLMSFPGVGKKTSRQIILDLKGKLTSLISVTTSKDAVSSEDSGISEVLLETKETLKALGYTEREINGIIPQLQQVESKNTDEMVRQALALLMKN